MNIPEKVFSSFSSESWIVSLLPLDLQPIWDLLIWTVSVGLKIRSSTRRCSVHPVLFTSNQATILVGLLLGSVLCPVGHFVLAQVLSMLDYESTFDRDYTAP